jgi:uncharacterized membrane protein YdjX (TVP38/TMEM64 family)
MPLAFSKSGGRWARILLTVAVVCVIFAVNRGSGLWELPERLRELGVGGRTAALIILVMAFMGAFALPASAFLFITPLLFPPRVSALITTAGFAVSTGVGYAVARFVGGPWVERSRDGRLRRFLARHSSFLVLFGIRLTPSSPHGFISYAAGLAAIPFARFLVATTAAMAIKSYVYAEAVHGTVGAKSLTDVVSAKTLLALSSVALLAFVGHALGRRFARETTETGREGEGEQGTLTERRADTSTSVVR